MTCKNQKASFYKCPSENIYQPSAGKCVPIKEVDPSKFIFILHSWQKMLKSNSGGVSFFAESAFNMQSHIHKNTLHHTAFTKIWV